jgi:hypothetical protein
MSYFSQTDIEQYTGYGSGDFKQAGITMTATQWAAFCTTIVDTVTQMIDRFCNVTSFESHAVIEYHDGQGAQGDDETYIPYDNNIYLREYATGVTEVAVDTSAKSGTIQWATKWERSTATAGDFSVATRYELTQIQFHNNVPSEGSDNVRITYYAGYPSGSVELNEIKNIGLRIAQNILVYKKKIAESMTIRSSGVRDYSEMFKPIDERLVFTEDIRRDLHKYRRYRMGGMAWS